jgi:ankyrin repeat protein
MFAARTGDVDLVKFLTASGADVNDASSDGFTALSIATGRAKVELMTYLLEHGADPNKGPGITPLHWVVGDWADYRYTAVARSEGDEWSEIQGYRGEARVAAVKLLLAHGANPNAIAQGTPPRYGQGRARGGEMAGATPFFVAAKNGDAAVLRLLVAAGANPVTPNNAQTTPLMVASGVGQSGGGSPLREAEILEAVKVCVELGNDVNATNGNGETALHGAAYRGIEGPPSLVQFLVANGAKVNAKNKFGWTPLAISEGIYYGGSDTRSDKIAEVLRSLGATPSGPEVERNAAVAAQKAGLRRR